MAMAILTNLPTAFDISPLPSRLTRSVTNLPSQDHQILLQKRQRLTANPILLPQDVQRRITARGIPNPAAATLVFAQQEAGTAVCISPRGVLLTCSHCFAEPHSDLDWSRQHWLLFSSGALVAARTIALDPRRDLALLLITHCSSAPASQPAPFPHLPLSSSPAKPGARLLCIGHPGSEDLEAAVPGVQTSYDTLVLSAGACMGLAGDDAQDNEEIGALAHTCWTYWGHSGAPLVDGRTGGLAGVHSSWDEETGMRRGVPWEAVVAFLEEAEAGCRDGFPECWVLFTRL